jgi:hypothetical protein
MSTPKKFTLKLTRSQLVTLHFAMNNYRHILRSEISRPSRAHGPAESAAAIIDLDELAEAIPAIPQVNR